jgi:hypothetical protein
MTKTDITALPAADAEQQHLLDEIANSEFVDAVHHEFAVRCSNCGTTQPVTISFRELPEQETSR